MAVLNWARGCLLRLLPFGCQKWLIERLAGVAQRVIHNPSITYRGHRVYLAPDDPSTARILVSYLFWRNWHHEMREQIVLEQLIKARHRVFFIDGGASFGMYSFLAASLPTVEQVLAIEASQDTYARLRRSIDHSSVAGRVRCVHGALVDSTERRLTLVTEVSSEWHMVTDSVTDEALIHAITIDGLVASLALAANDSLFIKLDIEGSEPDAVAGMTATLAADRDTVIMIEFHAGLLDRKPQGAREFARTLFETGMHAIYAMDTQKPALNVIPTLDAFWELCDQLSASEFPHNLRNLVMVKRGIGTADVKII